MSVLEDLVDRSAAFVAAPLDAAEQSRLAKRSKLRRMLAESRRNAAFITQNQAKTAEIEAEIESLAAQHAADCAELRERIAAAEQEVELDPTAELAVKARQSVLLELDGRARLLETNIKKLRQQMGSLAADSRFLANTEAGCNPANWETELVACASRAAVDRVVVAQSAAFWLRQRLQYAEAGPRRSYPIEGSPPMRTQAEYDAEVIATQAALTLAEAEAEAARQAAIAE